MTWQKAMLAALGFCAQFASAQGLPIPDPVSATPGSRPAGDTAEFERYNAPIAPAAAAPGSEPTAATGSAPFAPPEVYLTPAIKPLSGTSPERGRSGAPAGARQPDVLPIPAAVTAPASANTAAEQAISGAIGAVGPGDTLGINIMGTGGAQVRVTVDAQGQVVVPMLGNVQAAGLTPSALGRRIEQGLRSKGYMTDPQVAIEVVTMRSRIVSVLGQIVRPGRYPIEGRLSVLELLAMAGGATSSAADVATLVRRADGGRNRINLYVGNRQGPSMSLQDTELEPGDVVFVPEAPRFYVYGEVGKPGAYPLEQGLNVMRALALAGGLTPRASDSRIDINRTDVLTGEVTDKRVKLTDAVQPGDVIHVNERFF
ncbi:SLBB domain-containing protein [Bordetella genomosp. 12]|uniref:Sugar transporter n=1 Tax=Bordetella genomosp. 12 TaxID=463035 RepID=A0A261VBB3_9BORD|nr:SLBB domain-containing protein [Bordetella genomosp. 12]OZI70852.1 hypothetical protein CAL22_13195 [Bordetella genomosp. 12]